MRRGQADRFQRLLRWYPASWRQANGDIFVGSLRDQADDERRSAPSVADGFSALVNGVALRLDARVAFWAALLAMGLGACAWILMLIGWSGASGPGGEVGMVLADIAPALTLLGVVALFRERRLIAPPRALVVLLTLLAALVLAALTQLSWAQGFRLADANQPQTGLAGAWGLLFVIAWTLGAAGIGLLVDSAFGGAGMPTVARVPLAAIAGILIAPAVGIGLIHPATSTVIGAGVALVALGTLNGQRSRTSPLPIRAILARSSEVRGEVVRLLASLSAGVGVLGVVYALTGAGWSDGAADGTIAMAQGITVLLASAIPLLSAFALSAPPRHGTAVVWGPTSLIVLEITAVAVAYQDAPAGQEMAPWLGLPAALGGGAVAWWTIPRLRGPLGPRIAVGLAFGGGYAALFGTTVIPLLAFAVPVVALVLAFTRARPTRPKILSAAQTPLPIQTA